MSQSVRVTMLGYQQAGKTTYLIGMYHTLNLGIGDGFTIRTPDLDDSHRFGLQWQTMVTPGKDRWPPTTTADDEYQFEFEYRNQPFLDLEWYDYRGGIVGESFSDPDLQKLYGYLAKSDCILLCVSGQHLGGHVSVTAASNDIMAQKMREIIGQLVRDNPHPQRPLAIGIVVTKADYNRNPITRRLNMTQIERNVRMLFGPLFAPPSKGVPSIRSYLTAVIPVTMGAHLAHKEDRERIDPAYAELPVYFAVWAKLRGDRIDARASSDRQRAKDLRQQEGRLRGRLRKIPIFLDGKKV